MQKNVQNLLLALRTVRLSLHRVAQNRKTLQLHCVGVFCAQFHLNLEEIWELEMWELEIKTILAHKSRLRAIKLNIRWSNFC
jgi:hypothetical protein